MGILYMLATPIGNLEDITLRAVRVLKQVDMVLAEDTRVAIKLLNYYDVNKNILSYHQHSNEFKKLEILKYLLEGKNIAFLTDAGTPGISDPGNELIDFLCARLGNSFSIEVIPGPSALTAALSVCGFRTNNFVFLGFLPKKRKMEILKRVRDLGFTFAFFESSNRLLKSLLVIKDIFSGERRVLVARELNKIHETLYRGSIDTIIDQLSEEKVKGEIVVVVEGS